MAEEGYYGKGKMELFSCPGSAWVYRINEAQPLVLFAPRQNLGARTLGISFFLYVFN